MHSVSLTTALSCLLPLAYSLPVADDAILGSAEPVFELHRIYARDDIGGDESSIDPKTANPRCQFCPLGNLSAPNPPWSHCASASWIEDSQKTWGFCFNVKGDPDGVGSLPANLKWPDANYISQAKDFLAYFALNDSPKWCVSNAGTPQYSADISYASSNFVENKIVGNKEPDRNYLEHVLHGLHAISQLGSTRPNWPAPNLAHTNGIVVASVQVSKDGKTVQNDDVGHPLVFYNKKPGFNCETGRLPQWIPNNSLGFADSRQPGQFCTAQFQQVNNQNTYPIYTAVQLYDTNGFFMGFRNATLQSGAGDITVSSKQSVQFILHTDLAKNTVSSKNGAWSGPCAVGDWKNGYRIGACDFTC